VNQALKKIHVHQPLFEIPGVAVFAIISRTVLALLHIAQYSGVGFSDKQKQRQTSTPCQQDSWQRSSTMQAP